MRGWGTFVTMHVARGAWVGFLGVALGACGGSPQPAPSDAGLDAGAVAQVTMPADASVRAPQHMSDAGAHSAGDAATQSVPRDAGTRPVDASLADAPGPTDAAVPAEVGDTIPIVVAAGANHSLQLSIDEGQTFCQLQREEPADIGDGFDNPHLFRHITFANHHFVAGSWKVVLASSNGYEWDDVTDGSGPKLGNWVAEIDFGNGYWVGVGGYGGVMRSSDLQHWDRVDVAWENVAARSLVFGDGNFVASRDGMGWWSSTDGTVWTQFDAAQTTGVVFDDGKFIADPGYRRARGTRLRAGGGGIQRADDRDGAEYTTVATVQDGVADIAFGLAPAADYAPGKVTPPALASCLGL